MEGELVLVEEAVEAMDDGSDTMKKNKKVWKKEWKFERKVE